MFCGAADDRSPAGLASDNRRRWATHRFKAKNKAIPDLFDREADSSHKDADSSHKDGDSSPIETLRAGGFSDTVKTVIDSQRTTPALMEEAILDLCRGRYLTAQQLADLLHRNPAGLRNRYVSPMVAAEKLLKRYPQQGIRPDQAYTTAESQSPS